MTSSKVPPEIKNSNLAKTGFVPQNGNISQQVWAQIDFFQKVEFESKKVSKSKFQRLLSLKLSSLKFGAKWRIKVSNLLFETSKNTRDVTLWFNSSRLVNLLWDRFSLVRFCKLQKWATLLNRFLERSRMLRSDLGFRTIHKRSNCCLTGSSLLRCPVLILKNFAVCSWKCLA